MLPECEIIPVREIIVLDEDLERWNTLSFEYWKEVKYAEDLEEKFSFTRLKELFNGFEFLFPFLHSDHVSLFDYFQVKPSLIISEPEKALEGGAEILKQEALAHESCVNDGVISLPRQTDALPWLVEPTGGGM